MFIGHFYIEVLFTVYREVYYIFRGHTYIKNTSFIEWSNVNVYIDI